MATALLVVPTPRDPLTAADDLGFARSFITQTALIPEFFAPDMSSRSWRRREVERFSDATMSLLRCRAPPRFSSIRMDEPRLMDMREEDKMKTVWKSIALALLAIIVWGTPPIPPESPKVLTIVAVKVKGDQ